MSAATAKCRVLLVEDESLVAMDIEDAVRELGHDVLGPISELHEAVAAAADESLCCAILDINIRGGPSYPVADMLLGRGVPVLLLSGYFEGTLPERLHGVTLLNKPFTSVQLTTEIQNLCERVRHPSQ